MRALVNITDRAKRYRAQNAVTGPRKCVLCGSRSDIQVMHLDGNESHGEPANLAYGCRSCNGKLAAAFKRIGAGRPTNQYNPSSGVPTFQQYAWAVSNHARGSHDEGGVVIHATPKHKRIEYARRIAAGKAAKSNPWPFSKPDARRTTPASGGIAHHMAKRKLTGGSSAKSKAPKSVGASSMPTEAAIQAGFKRGLSLSEILAQNPGLQALRKSNPAKFDRCVKAVQAKGGAANAYAVCTAAGTRKANPSDWEAGNAVSGMASGAQARALKDHIEWVERIERRGRKLSKQELQILKQRFRKGAREKRNPRDTFWSPYGNVSGVNFSIGNDGVVVWSDDWDKLTRWAEKKQHGFSFRAGGPGTFGHTDIVYRKSNPAAASAEVFEEFHGYAPSEMVTVTKHIHHHEHLAAAGKLVSLDVWGVDDKGHKISGFKGALLAFNETKNQLFVEGGDQSIDLADFGIDSPHELETLGRLTDIGYQTNKTHLGDEGGEAVYVHKFRSTNRNGKHVVVKIARYPDLIYDVRNEQLLFSGGSYEILREGIDK